jgi:hypothetical protein
VVPSRRQAANRVVRELSVRQQERMLPSSHHLAAAGATNVSYTTARSPWNPLELMGLLLTNDSGVGDRILREVWGAAPNKHDSGCAAAAACLCICVLMWDEDFNNPLCAYACLCAMCLA